MVTSPPLRFDDLRLPAAEFSDPAAPEYRLCLVLEGEAELGWQQDDRWVSARLRPGMFAPLTPPDTFAQLRLGASQRHLMVTMEAAGLDEVSAELGDGAHALDRLCAAPFRNPWLARLCLEAHAQEQRGDALSGYFRSGLAPILIASLLRSGMPAPKRDSARSRALPPALLARLRERCLERLDAPLPVALLAAWSGLPEAELTRQLRLRTGETPHQFVLGLRLGRAAALLREGSESLATVAGHCGFFDQSHLSQAFRRRYGQSPARYRRAQRPDRAELI